MPVVISVTITMKDVGIGGAILIVTTLTTKELKLNFSEI